MAKRDCSFLLPEPRDLAFDRVLDAVGNFGWHITKLTPPGRFYRLIPEINFRAGPEQLDGCGRTRVQLDRAGVQQTRVKISTRWALTESRAETPAISLLKGLRLDPEGHHLNCKASRLPGRSERKMIRLSMAAVVVATLVALILVPVPTKDGGRPAPPAVALNNSALFHVEVALLAFYGGLLLLTSAFAGLFRGRLPSEISTKGAKYEEEVKRSDENTELTQVTIDEHTEQIGTLMGKIAVLHREASEGPTKSEVGNEK
jgi:hypothetical protein